MEFPIASLVPIIILVPFIIIDVYIFYKAQKLRASPLYILTSALFLNTIIMLFTTIGFSSIDRQTSSLSYSISLFMTPILLLILIYFFESYERHSYFSFRTTSYLVTVTFICVTMLYISPLELIPVSITFASPNPGNWIPVWQTWFIIANFTISVIFGMQAVLIIRRAYKIIPKHAHKLLIHMTVAIILYSLSASSLFIVIRTLFFIIEISNQLLPIFLQLSVTIPSISQIYFVICYGLLSNHPGWLQISKIHKILVMTDTGITIFSHSFTSSNNNGINKQIDDQLLGGAFNALRKFFGEIVGNEAGEVQEIKLANFSMLIEVSENKFLTALLADSTTIFGIRMLKVFTKSFYRTFGTYLNNWDGNIELFKNAEILVKRCFEDVYF